MPPPELMIDALLYVIVPALVLAAIVMAAVTLVAGAQNAPAAAALGLAAGAGLALWLRDALTLMPGDSSWNRLPWAALGMFCVGRVARLPELPALDGLLLRAAAALGAAWWLIPEDARAELVWLAPAFAAVVWAEWMLLDQLAAEPPGGVVPFLLALTFFTASIVLIYAQTARLSETALVFSSALAGIALIAAWWRIDTGGVIAPAVLMLSALMLVGQRETFNDALWWPAFALTAAAPLMLAPTLVLQRFGGFGVRLLQLVLVLIPLSIAFWLALQTGPLQFE